MGCPHPSQRISFEMPLVFLFFLNRWLREYSHLTGKDTQSIKTILIQKKILLRISTLTARYQYRLYSVRYLRKSSTSDLLIFFQHCQFGFRPNLDIPHLPQYLFCGNFFSHTVFQRLLTVTPPCQLNGFNQTSKSEGLKFSTLKTSEEFSFKYLSDLLEQSLQVWGW